MIERGLSWSGHERNCAFLNLGDGRFADVSSATGLDFSDDGRALAVVDWDGDGALDLWLKNRTGPQLRLLHNRLRGAGHFVSLALAGTSCNRDAIGAIVELRAGGRRLRRELRAGEGYLAQSSKRLHFGLGQASVIDELAVHWPGGAVERFEPPAVDRAFRLTQGSGRPEPLAPRRIELAAAAAPRRPPPGAAAVPLKQPLPLPPTLTGMLERHGVAGRTVLIDLWAHWCEPCIRELDELSGRHAELRDVGLDLVALSVDAAEDLPVAAALFAERFAAQTTGGGFDQAPILAAERDAIDALLEHVLGRSDELVLPTSLLIDPAGRLQVVYLGPVAADDLLADTRRFVLTPVKASRRGAYPGRWYFRTPRNLAALAEALIRRGRDDDAAWYTALAER